MSEKERRILPEGRRGFGYSVIVLLGFAAGLGGSRLAGRGLHPEPLGSEGDCDLRLVDEATSALDVARCVPVARVAGVVDVKEMEAWRQMAGARRAYLIALAGFSPAAVRMARELPITL